jgi:Putative beta-barrel porin-2, OmpL-like. bbp2
MRRSKWVGASLAAFLSSVGLAQAQLQPTSRDIAVVDNPAAMATHAVFGTPQTVPQTSEIIQVQAPEATPAPMAGSEPPIVGSSPESRGVEFAAEEGAPAPDAGGYGPTPLTKVGILDKLIYGDNAKDATIHFTGWIDADYTFRSTGPGQNNIAPVMNRFGDEALLRQIGLYIYKPLDPKCLSWGFNCIFIAGADASFLTPIGGGWNNTNPRFGGDFTDLNLTLHLPILTEGGVDIKAGRQTTCLGPMGALPWQRYFDSSDYAWFNMEEGRYTGVSSVWHVSKRLDWYNGIEFGWGDFFDYYSPAPQYLTQISYWLDEEAKKAKIWTTVLTGPTGEVGTGNTTVFELGLQINYNQYIYQTIDTQMVWSKCPIFGPKPPGYNEEAYDVYTYLGAHLNKCWDINSRFEWYRDVNGGGYPGGFGIPNTDYYAVTVGPDYHPVSWLQFRPEIRYDYATNPAFGSLEDKKSQLSIAADVLIKF